jgi:hypothetical protein
VTSSQIAALRRLGSSVDVTVLKLVCNLLNITLSLRFALQFGGGGMGNSVLYVL